MSSNAIVEPKLGRLLRLTDALGIDHKYAAGAYARGLQVLALVSAIASTSRHVKGPWKTFLIVTSVLETGGSQLFYTKLGNRLLKLTVVPEHAHGKLGKLGKAHSPESVWPISDAVVNTNAEWNILGSLAGMISRFKFLSEGTAMAWSGFGIFCGLVLGLSETRAAEYLFERAGAATDAIKSAAIGLSAVGSPATELVTASL